MKWPTSCHDVWLPEQPPWGPLIEPRKIRELVTFVENPDDESHEKTTYSFHRAAVTKYHTQGGLNRKVFFHSSGDKKSEIKVSAGLVPSEGCERESVPCPSPSFW